MEQSNYLIDTNSVIDFLGNNFPDAIIAATAIAYDLTLITRNLSDFNKITEVKTINLHSY
jgi:predicted nucleic acid-binding protein